MQDGNLRSFGMMLDGRLPTTSIRRCGEDATLLIVLNAHDDNCPVHPSGDGGRKAVDKASAAELGKGMPGPAPSSSAVKTIGAACAAPAISENSAAAAVVVRALMSLPLSKMSDVDLFS